MKSLAVKPYFSVIIPTYNRADIISETIESVLCQTFSDFELLIIDNGSSDRTRDVVLEFDDSRISYFWQKGTGSPAGPRNTGIKMARAPWISFIDSDDLWDSEKLERVKRFTESYPDAVFIHHNFKIKKNSKKDTIRKIPFKRIPYYSGNIYNNLIVGKCDVGILTVSVKRNVLEKIGKFNEDPLMLAIEDYDLWLRISENYPVYFLNESLATFRLHESNESKKVEDLEKGIKAVMEKHILNNKNLSKKIKRKGLSFLYFTMAVRFYVLGDLDRVRNRLNKAIALTPFNLNLYIYYLKSFLGRKTLFFLRSLKEHILAHYFKNCLW